MRRVNFLVRSCVYSSLYQMPPLILKAPESAIFSERFDRLDLLCSPGQVIWTCAGATGINQSLRRLLVRLSLNLKDKHDKTRRSDDRGDLEINYQSYLTLKWPIGCNILSWPTDPSHSVVNVPPPDERYKCFISIFVLSARVWNGHDDVSFGKSTPISPWKGKYANVNKT